MPREREGLTRRSRVKRMAVVAAVVALALVGESAGKRPESPAAAVSPTPPVTAGLQLWYEAESPSYNNGQKVQRWTDKSGFGRDLTPAAGNAAPTMRRGVVNGRAAVEFDGSSSLLKTYGSTFTLAQPTTFFVVYRSLDANTSARAFVFDSRDSSVRQVFGRPGSGGIRMYANLDLDFGGISYPFSSFQMWSGTFNGASSSLHRNGTPVGAGNAGGSSLSGFTVGGLSTTGPYGYDLSRTQIAEILYYGGALSAADRDAVTSWLNEKYAVVGPPAPPANTAPPAITGTATDGASLAVSTGSWSGSQPLSYAYQWRRCDGSGGSCADIAGATSSGYTAGPADVGGRLVAAVTATNGAGSATASSAPTAVVTAGAPLNTTAPSISGVAREGETLTADDGAWTGTAPISYARRWQRCDGSGASCADIPGATAATYVLAPADIGSRIRVAVTGTNGGGSTTATSAATSAVLSSSSPGTGQPPVVSGLELWFEADSQSYTDGARVTRWTDGSGFGRDLTAFDNGAAPVFRRDAVNGRAAVEFDGSSSLLKTYGSTFTLAQPTTFFVVYRSLDANTSARAFVFDSRDSANRQVFGRAALGEERLYANVDLDVPGIAYPFSGFQIRSGTFNGAASSLHQNGALLAAGNAGGAGLAGFTLGGLSTSAQYGYDRTHSLVAEVLYYTGALSASDRDAVTSWLDGKYDVVGPAAAPANTVPPSISGPAADGATLTADRGTWSGTQPLTYGYRWQRCAAGGTSCSDIAGATSSTYVPGSADVGSAVRVVVTASNAGGSASAASAATAAVGAAPPANAVAPSISGTARDGSTLTADRGTWTGTSPLSYGYQWQRCGSDGSACTAIAGATATTYDLTSADVGSTIAVVVTASNSVGVTSATSSRTPAVAAAGTPAPSTQPPVTGGLQLWYEAETETAADGDRVGTWSDKSGNGRDLTAFDGSQRPVIHRGAVNARAALEFDGSTSLMKTYSSTFTLPQPTTFFIVYRALETASPGYEAYVFDSRDSTHRQLLGLGPFGNTEMYADIDIEAPTPYPFPAYQIWSGTFLGASSAIWRNGSLVAASNAGNASISGFTVGALSTSAQYGYHYGHSLVAEILYYTGAMTEADRTAVTSWLNQKYATY